LPIAKTTRPFPSKYLLLPIQNTMIMSTTKGPVSQFIEKNYLHFNAAALMDAAKGYETHLTEGGKMMVTLAGAMSTAELGISLAEMIRQGKIDIISCTGANLEEDIMNLVAHSHYKRVPNYRDLSPQDEWDLLENHYNRVTDTCIPEEEAFRRLQKHIHKLWKDADTAGERYFPHEYMYKMLLSGVLEQYYEIDPKNSWISQYVLCRCCTRIWRCLRSLSGAISARYLIQQPPTVPTPARCRMRKLPGVS
jgi:deoxyhypusine synthase